MFFSLQIFELSLVIYPSILIIYNNLVVSKSQSLNEGIQ